MTRPSKQQPERQAWERMEGESVKAFSVFTSYLHMKPTERSYANLVKMYAKSEPYVNQIKRWASKYEWQARLVVWVEHQAADTESEYDKARLEVRKTRQNLTRIMLSYAGRATKQLNDGLVDIDELEKLSRAMTRILDQARQEFNDLATQRSEVDADLNIQINYVRRNPKTGKTLDGD